MDKTNTYCPACMEKISPDTAVCPHCGHNIRIENATHQLPVGTVLKERYQIGAVLGEGGFGITYIGRDLTLDVRVAVKEYYPSTIANRHHTGSLEISVGEGQHAEIFGYGKTKFLEEARILAQFYEEPNIVSVRDFFTENDTAYIVMEFLDGVDLREYLKDHGPMSFSEVFSMLEPVMTALEKVHEKGLIHRDISPSNLKLLKTGKVKLLDFGTAREVDYLGENSLSVMLKPGYSPEEQYRSHSAQGEWTDVYAMCATIYKLITGNTPENAMNRMYQDHLSRPIALGARISPGQESVLLKGLAVRLEDRIQTMKELRQEFLLVREEYPEPVGGSDEDDEEKTAYKPKYPMPNQTEEKHSDKHRAEPNPLLLDHDSKDDDHDINSNKNEKGSSPISAVQKSAEVPVGKGSKHHVRNPLRFPGKLFLAVPALLVAFLALFVLWNGGLGEKNAATLEISGRTASVSGGILTKGILKKVANQEVTKLEISDCEISDDMFSQIAKLDKLYSLHIENCGLQSFPTLGSMENLGKLSLSGNQIRDLRSVADLTNLKSLDLSENEIEDISDLEILENLQELDLSGNKIEDISALGSLKDLFALELSNNVISDISALSGCEKINYLSLSNNRLENLDGCERMIELHSLKAAGNQISDIEGLKNSTLLTYVDLTGNQISDISALQKNREQLVTLMLAGNQISDITPLEGSTNLYVVALEYNCLTNLDGLSGSTDLYCLTAYGNQISDISGISNCEGLAYLDLGENEIVDVSPLAAVKTGHWVLMLQNNRISDISALPTECSYGSLFLYNNPTCDFSVMRRMTNPSNSSLFIYLYVSWNEGWDCGAIAESSFNIQNINIVDAPLDQRTKIKEVFKDGSIYEPSFISLQEADENLVSYRQEKIAQIYHDAARKAISNKSEKLAE